MISLSGIALTYSLISGLKASIITDVIQMLMILIICFTLIPLCFFKFENTELILNSLSGINNDYKEIFNPWVVFSIGIPMTISLLSGPFVDQMFYQRTFAVKKAHLKETFIYGGLIFTLIPVSLSLLGFLAVGMEQSGVLKVTDPQMVAPAVINALLPKTALYAFCLMAFAGLCSTMDSSFCALSSLGSIDIYKNYIRPDARKDQVIWVSRLFMIALAIIGSSISLLQPKLLWVFLTYGAIAGSGVIPIVCSLLFKSISAKALSLSIKLSLALSLPIAIYANV